MLPKAKESDNGDKPGNQRSTGRATGRMRSSKRERGSENCSRRTRSCRCIRQMQGSMTKATRGEGARRSPPGGQRQSMRTSRYAWLVASRNRRLAPIKPDNGRVERLPIHANNPVNQSCIVAGCHGRHPDSGSLRLYRTYIRYAKSVLFYEFRYRCTLRKRWVKARYRAA